MEATTSNCPNCGPYPCSHQCPNSPHYYSLEQERADEANYDPSEYYREGGFADPEPEWREEDDEREEAANAAAEEAYRYRNLAIPTHQFSYDRDRRLFVAETSNLPWGWATECARDRFDLQSERTGRRITVALTRELRDGEGDLYAWEFKPIGASRDLFTVHVLND